MGCDIHTLIERRLKPDDLWHVASDVSLPSLDGRNYNLFAMLADVRNKNGIQPIHDPRGVPEDIDPEHGDEIEDWGIDGHSHSWATVTELLAYAKRMGEEKFQEHGVLCGPAYLALKTGVEPTTWCGRISGQKIITVDSESFDDMATKLVTKPTNWWGREQPTTFLGDFEVYVRATWPVTYASILAPLVEELKQVRDPDNVRVVYFFDN